MTFTWATGEPTTSTAESTSYPVGKPSTYYFSKRDLITNEARVIAGSQSFVTIGAGAPSSTDSPDVIDGFVEPPTQLKQDAAGTFASYDTRPLTRAVDVVGSPVAQVKVNVPQAFALAQGQDVLKLVLFFKIVDVAGSEANVVRNLVAPVRVPDITEPFKVTMPAFVHHFEAGHKIRLVVAGGSINYRGGNTTTPVTIATGDQAPLQSLTLRTLGTVPSSDGTPAAPSTPAVPGTSGGNAGGSGTSTGASGSNGNAGGNGNDSDTAGGQSQAAPATTAAYTSPLPDTGGPSLGLLGAGLLLVLLGAHQLVRYRRGAVS